jgi:hypothetical protein
MSVSVARALALIALLSLLPTRAAAQAVLAADGGVEQPAAEPLASEAPAADDAALAAALDPEVVAGQDYALSEAELENLGLMTEDGEATATDTSTQVHGFVDFGSYTIFTKAWRRALQPHTSFFIGNFNVYISKNLTDTVRMFSEVRFTYLPNGALDYFTSTVTSTAVPDYSNFSANLKWGGIEIERVYLEWSMTPWLTLRAGQFLTPYGIWNVDHGSPTIISVIQPHVIAQQLFPKRQTGLELRGQVPLSGNHTLGYHLTISNGLGPASEYVDLDDNKALGGRLWWSFEGFGQLTVGASGFIGTDADVVTVIGLDANQKLSYTEKVNGKSTVLSLAADIQWRYDAFQIQAEWVSRQNKYHRDGRPVQTHPVTGIRSALIDGFDTGGYLLAGYRFEWLGVMPFFALHYVDYLERRLSVRPKAYVLECGLNIRPIDAVVLKVQYQAGFWPEGFAVNDDPYHSMYLQLAWAF